VSKKWRVAEGGGRFKKWHNRPGREMPEASGICVPSTMPLRPAPFSRFRLARAARVVHPLVGWSLEMSEPRRKHSAEKTEFHEGS